ncbi:hypothetical protein BSKO_08318 [Bryopsis sp. KO-2023]|nr:hypothetical protein BSKO_08318 [Bryopsis sp. KO-2023]
MAAPADATNIEIVAEVQSEGGRVVDEPAEEVDLTEAGGQHGADQSASQGKEAQESSMDEEVALIEAQAAVWKRQNRTSEVWGCFRSLGKKKENDIEVEGLACIFCCKDIKTLNDVLGKQRSPRGIIMYKSTSGTGSIRKHAISSHGDIFKRMKSLETERENKKRKNIMPQKSALATTVTQFFHKKRKYKANSKQQQIFIQDLLLFIVKELQPLSIVEGPFFRQMLLRCDPNFVFPSRRRVRDVLLKELRQKVDREHVAPILKVAGSISLTFDLWMSRKTEDLFAMIAHWIGDDWAVYHRCLGLVKANHTDGSSLSNELHALLVKYNIANRVLGSTKDQGSNMQSCIKALDDIQQKSGSVHIVDSLPSLLNRFDGTCYAHLISTALSKVFTKQQQRESQIDHGFSTIKFFELKTQLQSQITYTKKSSKGRQLWNNAQEKCNESPITLITPVKTRMGSTLAMFEQCLRKRKSLHVLYTDLVEAKYQDRRLSRNQWMVVNAVCDVLKPVCIVIVKQQTRASEYWLLSDAVATMTELFINLRNEPPPLQELEEFDDEIFKEEIRELRKRVTKVVRDTIFPSVSPLISFSAGKGHTMLSLMLDPKYKSMRIVSKLINDKGRVL